MLAQSGSRHSNRANLILAGTGRAGTTSLYRYLSDHPSVCASSVKEVHFFDNLSSNHLSEDVLRKYDMYFSHCPAGIPIRMEATPLYLYGGKTTANAINEALPDVKLIFTLRDPTSRAFTIFRANKNRDPRTFGSLSFNDFVSIGLNTINSASGKHIDERAKKIAKLLTQGCYATFLSQYYDIFHTDRICILFFDDIVKDIRRVMRVVADFIEIDFEFYAHYIFNIENRTRIFRFGLLHQVAYAVNARMERTLNRYPKVRKNIRNLYNMVNERKASDEIMSEESRHILNQFYRPHNLKLFKLLKQESPALILPAWICEATDGW